MIFSFLSIISDAFVFVYTGHWSVVGVGRPTHAEFNPREELRGSSELRNPPAPELRPHLRLERFGVPTFGSVQHVCSLLTYRTTTAVICTHRFQNSLQETFIYGCTHIQSTCTCTVRLRIHIIRFYFLPILLQIASTRKCLMQRSYRSVLPACCV